MSSPSRRVWFITGASRGFGLEIARVALDRGDAVVGHGAGCASRRGGAAGPRRRFVRARARRHQRGPGPRRGRRGGRALRPHRRAGQQRRPRPARRGRGGDGTRTCAAVYETNVFGLLACHPRGAAGSCRTPARRAHRQHGARWAASPRGSAGASTGSTKFAVEGLSEALGAGARTARHRRDDRGAGGRSARTSWTGAPCTSPRARSTTTRTPSAACAAGRPPRTARSRAIP